MIFSRIPSLLTLLAILLVTGACGQPSIAVDRDRGTTTCADLIVFGLRGSGQDPNKNDGVGQEADRSIRNMAGRLKDDSDTTVRLEAVRYDATIASSYAHYEAGVKDGVRLLGKQYAAAVEKCPSSRFAIVGFSQGAQVVHEFAYGLTGTKARHLALIGMIADPRRNPADSIRHWSYATKPTTRSGKLGAGPAFGPEVRKAAISLCIEDDEVCNAPRGGGLETMSSIHKHFYESDKTAAKTGKQLFEVLAKNGLG